MFSVVYSSVRDTSSNDTSSTTTLRRNFLSNYQFVEKSLRRMHFRRIRHLVEIFSRAWRSKISRRRHAVLGVLIMCLSREIGNFSFKAVSTP